MFTQIFFTLSVLGLASAAPAPARHSHHSSSSSASVSASASAASPSTSGSAVGTGSTFEGTATYYYQGGNPGSCGDYHSDSDFIVAVNAPQQSGSCGKKVVITNTKNGMTATALAADTCPGCEYGSLDMSEGLFSYLGNGDMDQGVFPITWQYAEEN